MDSRMLESYACGRWYRAADEGRPVNSPVDGAEVARVSSTGLDVAAMATYAREVGGPALAALTFHERAAALKTLAMTLMAGKAEFYAESARTGATERDSGVDIDGGFGTLLSYAGKAKRELPNDVIHLDGPVEQLGKKGTFVARHVFTSRRGVAVQINAYNFPVWGFLEKLAPAFIAGVPTIVKPATQTSYLTELVFRRIIESGILPEGSVQLLVGDPEQLLTSLGGQDSVAFTGSARTAAVLRSHPVLVERGVHFTAEADSLNASVLGVDVAADAPEFELYVKQLVAEMTTKAGQKCTAIRRALVPEGMVDAVIDATRARLDRVVVGAPLADGVTMGPVVSLSQRTDVLAAVDKLRASAELVVGDPQDFEVVGGDATVGAYLPPMLLRSTDPEAPEVHEIEAFGPVATVVGYRDTAHAVGLIRRGGGSLVASLVTADGALAREVLLGIAPYHGRLLVLNAEDARESTGHGSPLPMLVHGGPGRAGGGEELGGIRGVLHHMQRTAIQGTPAILAATTGQWLAGAPRTASGVHPFRKSLAELQIGDTIVGGPRTVRLADIDHFAEFTGDTFYAHTDPVAAAANPLFGGIVAHGYLVVSLAAGLFVDPAPGPVLANFGVDSLRFLTPVKADDALTVTLTAKQITPRSGAEYGEVRWDAVVTNQDDAPVATYDVLTLVAKTLDGGAGA
ncbi:phenylacetic acid degradation bifunctional protein PaaZ [Tsukamurella sp. NPDC003166]|uniref:phenylacetic acid degradation bifunctional protein PaaZ n=1 Tax=Tsukamurella sp. NPDC003166 TaxID=3154444 RepID=UPI0033AEF47D